MNLKFWKPAVEVTQDATRGLLDYFGSFTYNGRTYPILNQTSPGSPQENIAPDYQGIAQQAYMCNPVVFACCQARSNLFQEARFQFRRLRSGRPGELFGTGDLQVLEEPWPGGTTRALSARAIQDHDLAGNWFGALRAGPTIRRLRPDWVTIILGTPDPQGLPGDVDTEVIGYMFKPGGSSSGRDPVFFLADEVAHFSGPPDPTASFRGMSWITTVIREIMGDKAATEHKLSFFEVGTPNMIIKVDPLVKPEQFEFFEQKFRQKYESRGGDLGKYAAMILGGGADATVVGSNFEQTDFKAVQGAGETRISAAAGTPPVIVGLSEGLAASTYSNYGQARRAFADLTIRPLLGKWANTLAQFVTVPGDAELWYDDRDISFMQEDVKDDAQIQGMQASTIRTLLDAGYEPQSVQDAVVSGDWNRLVHTGLFSVQLQPPGSEDPEPESNGNGPADEVVAALGKIGAKP